jgi:hypothetical protein
MSIHLPARCHRLGVKCYVRPSGCREWLEGRVVETDPLVALIVERHPIWHGAKLCRRDGLIRVDPRSWPETKKGGAD